MPHREKLKLTITAVGEPDSIFLQPCEPITLHDSQVDVEDAAPADPLAYAEGPGLGEAEAALASLAHVGEMVILADTPPKPRARRLAS
ncbi:MAG: hypothetical protein AAF800_02140 [Planctomycetota bacterium]